MTFKKMTLIYLSIFLSITVPVVDYRVHLLAGEFETHGGPMWNLGQPGGYQVNLGKSGWPQIVQSCNPGLK